MGNLETPVRGTIDIWIGGAIFKFPELQLVLYVTNKGGKFLKKLWCCVGGRLINWVDNVNWPL